MKTFRTAAAWYENGTKGPGTLQMIFATFANAKICSALPGVLSRLSLAKNIWPLVNVDTVSSNSSCCINCKYINRIWHKTHRKSHGVCKYCHSPDISNGSLVDASTRDNQNMNEACQILRLVQFHITWPPWPLKSPYTRLYIQQLTLLRLTPKKISKVYTTCQSNRRVISEFATQRSNNAESTHGWSVHLPHKRLMIQKAFLSHNITCAPQTVLTGRRCRPKKHSSTWEAQCKIKTSLNKCIDAKKT